MAVDVRAGQGATILPSAVVTAGVVTSHLTLHDGAQFTGPVNTERAKAAASVARHRQKT